MNTALLLLPDFALILLGAGIRRWMKHLSQFIASFDFIHAEPQPNWISRKPGNLVVSALVVPGRDYAA